MPEARKCTISARPRCVARLTEKRALNVKRAITDIEEESTIHLHMEGTKGPYFDLDVQALAVAVFKDEKAGDGLLKELSEKTAGVVASVIESEEIKGKEKEKPGI